MKIIFLLVLVTFMVSVSLGEYPKYKVRGPSPQHRYHQDLPHHYVKKWQQHAPSRNQVRGRPIPVHMPPGHKIPLGIPPKVSRPIAPPVRSFWKNTQTSFKIPVVEKPYMVKQQEQKYLSLPVVVNTPEYEQHQEYDHQEFDHQIQSNTISTHNNPIKQVDEKGPIHTIPAPNLSLADKPVGVEEQRPQLRLPQAQYLKLEQTHQYQVTEQNEPSSMGGQSLYRNQQFQQQPQQQQQQQQLYYTGEAINLPPPSFSYHSKTPDQKSPDNEVFLGNQLNQKELLQLLGQQQLLQTYLPEQQSTNYQALLAQQPQLFQPEANYGQLQQASDKVGEAPEYHSFNYEEQRQTKSHQVTEASSIARNSLDAVAQAQYIQSYFDTRDNLAENDVEPDAKPSVVVAGQKSEDVVDGKQELLSSAYYSSLPNKQAAETLAQLQAAGKINSNLMISGKNHMTIYVPDDFEEAGVPRKEQLANDDEHLERSSSLEEYDDEEGDYPEDMISEESRSEEKFGHRLQPKDNSKE